MQVFIVTFYSSTMRIEQIQAVYDSFEKAKNHIEARINAYGYEFKVSGTKTDMEWDCFNKDCAFYLYTRDVK